ncbi:MAG: phosphopantothenoylcysteine decarboxylase, partial [Bacteroidia bacterium]|nr:phosphopantothenoylcysteine decarboxylase [Bacteroidia bacterium]
AGPTHEAIDPVRFIGNRSSGKMGVALAEECADRGALVQLIMGPGTARSDHPSVKTTQVETGEDMFKACQKHHGAADVVIFAAAVADYRPAEIHTEKIKKSGDSLQINLERTIDIAATLGKQKNPGQIHIGFALETSKAEEFAQEKLVKKNFDFIVLNSLRDKGAGFQHDTNKVTLYTNQGEKTEYELKSKKEVATDIINTLVLKYLKS